MWCKMSIPDGLSALIRRYSSPPSTASYIAAKSMAGTVRVPSMSKTMPLRRTLGVEVAMVVVRLAIGNGSFGCKKRRDLDKDDMGIGDFKSEQIRVAFSGSEYGVQGVEVGFGFEFEGQLA
ncbi:hypothetical protein CIPAW_01G175700 [Carya illinoinensis]|uniref:Uncharacterized protein n=1 Tax=Carya illinoinensis TaxID=32201 RepID=A0A8T1RMA6_CARIL|nr:hypothetical protein CIPAW_01G175700 [Carya illinoinensis]